ncbi:MAG: DUF4139 domain-containing protein [Nitrospirota bacterium]
MKKTLVIAIFLLFQPQLLMAGEPVKSTLEDQTAVSVTVYNSGLGLVKDIRRIAIPKGQGELHFMDVASSIMPVTVSVRSTTAPNQFRVLEQNYEYDLMNHGKVLDKYVGKKIKLVTWNNEQDRKESTEATLLSNEGQIFKIDNEIYLGHPGFKVVPEIPENLISKPTLAWVYDNDGAVDHTLEVSYLTNGISWNADYVLSIDANDQRSDLSGWVTINNGSGATYNRAKLKVVAGDVNRVPVPQAASFARMKGEIAMAEASADFSEQAFFEYHIYDLQRPTTIKNHQTKQISLLGASGVGLVKEFLVRSQQYYYYQPFSGQDPKQPVEVFIIVVNSKENHLGMPLPAGTIRMYKKDKDGSSQFIGEDNIQHTPKDEKVRLKAGDAFDLVVERKQTDFRQVTSKVVETEWEMTLKNRKENEDVVISLLESVSGDWDVVSESHKHKKEDAFTIRYDVPVKKTSEITVKYRVRVKHG